MIKYIHTLIILSLIFTAKESYATCDSCFLPRTGRDSGFSLGADSEGAFFDFRYEYQNWDSQETTHQEAEVEEEHDHSSHDHEVETHSATLRAGDHDGGHEEEGHSHNRTQDRIYHFTGGYNFSDTFSVLFHMPYLEKFEVQDSGSENSEGFGDLSLVATWRVIKSEKGFLGPVVGVKLPTGQTNDTNSLGQKFETELQPGTGSTDVIMGGAFERRFDSLIFRGNALYFLRNEGTQEYEFGDTTSLSLFADYVAFEKDSTTLYTGVDLNYQHSSKNKESSEQVIDSGADIIYLGPNFTLKQGNDLQFSAAVLFPVAQDRGGNHQDVEAVYTVGGRYIF